MRLRDATRSRINLVLLKYANETNCKWLSKIGVSPANYLKVTLSDSNIASSFDENALTAANPAINLATDQLIRMVDPRYVAICYPRDIQTTNSLNVHTPCNFQNTQASYTGLYKLSKNKVKLLLLSLRGRGL